MEAGMAGGEVENITIKQEPVDTEPSSAMLTDPLKELEFHLECETEEFTPSPSEHSNFATSQADILAQLALRNLECFKNHAESKTKKPRSTAHEEFEPFPCHVCGQIFNNKRAVARHMAKHKQGDRNKNRTKDHKCEVCQKGFYDKCNLKIHMRTHTGERPFKCDICERTFAHKSSYKMHYTMHSGERPHVCGTCGRSFPQHSLLKVHVRIHTGEKPYQCEFCPKKFSDRSSWRSHTLRHKPERPHTCEICGKQFAVKNELTYHFKKFHTGEKSHKCSECPQAFCQKSELNSHMKTHSAEPPVTCEFCDLTFLGVACLQRHQQICLGSQNTCVYCDDMAFDNRDLLLNHSKTEHSASLQHRCEVCGRGFKFQTGLQQHHRVHATERPFKCRKCSKAFASKKYCEFHEETVHAESRPFICETCGQGFIQNSHLTVHLRKHTGERPYKCHLCDKAYMQQCRLTSHLLVHSGKRPYKCEFCGRSFFQRSHLTLHKKGHSDEKAHTCMTCGKGFNQKSSLKNHLKTHSKPGHRCSACGLVLDSLKKMKAHRLTHDSDSYEDTDSSFSS